MTKRYSPANRHKPYLTYTTILPPTSPMTITRHSNTLTHEDFHYSRLMAVFIRDNEDNILPISTYDPMTRTSNHSYSEIVEDIKRDKLKRTALAKAGRINKILDV